jgi:hypothetical protein
MSDLRQVLQIVLQFRIQIFPDAFFEILHTHCPRCSFIDGPNLLIGQLILFIPINGSAIPSTEYLSETDTPRTT